MAKKTPDPARPRIHAVRRQRVVLDAELAKLYGVPTKRLNQAVRRNAQRFPEAFPFIITREKLVNLRSQIATSSWGHGGGRVMSRVFTEPGALMAANVLRSEQAVQMSLYLIRPFVALREQLVSNLSTLWRRSEIDRKLLEHDAVLREVSERLQPLLNLPPAPKKPLIGFQLGNR